MLVYTNSEESEVVRDCYSGMCDGLNTCKKRQVQILATASYWAKIYHRHSFSYVRMTIDHCREQIVSCRQVLTSLVYIEIRKKQLPDKN